MLKHISRNNIFSVIMGIWLLELLAWMMAQFAVSPSFAETWGCRFWTIELTMVGLCGLLIIWTCIIINSLFSVMPHPFLLFSFSLAGIALHLPNGIATAVDYASDNKSAISSDYCSYSAITLAVAIITILLGLLHIGLVVLICCYKERNDCEC